MFDPFSWKYSSLASMRGSVSIAYRRELLYIAVEELSEVRPAFHLDDEYLERRSCYVWIGAFFQRRQCDDGPAVAGIVIYGPVRGECDVKAVDLVAVDSGVTGAS